MRNKKVLYLLIALVLVLAVGIGYASVSKNLYIRGSLETGAGLALEQNFKLNIVSLEELATGGDVTVKTPADGNYYGKDNGEPNVQVHINLEASNFIHAGDFCVVAVQVKNFSSDLAATILSELTGATSIYGETSAMDPKLEQYFDIVYRFSDTKDGFTTYDSVADDIKPADQEKRLEPDASTYVIVAIKLKSSPLESFGNTNTGADHPPLEFAIKLTGTAVVPA